MTVPFSQVIPSSAFFHVGLMVSFMALMAILSACCFVGVFDMTKQWMKDVDNTLTIEIPAYHSEERTILSQRAVEQNAQKVKNALEFDPLVADLKIKTFPTNTDNDETAIPEPVFMTVFLIPDRAEQSEERLVRTIKDLIPDVTVATAKDWERDIHNIAYSLQLLFGGLLVSSFMITAVTISTLIRMQVIAQEQTIHLIHLMGASTVMIASLFKKSITGPVVLGCGVAFGLSGCIMLVLLSLSSMEQNLYLCMSVGVVIAILFIALARVTTSLTVRKSLWDLP